MSKGTICFDFDGVIHSYTSGWQGVDVIPDPPVPGIKEAIAGIRADGYMVVVHSSRSSGSIGREAMKEWMGNYGIIVDGISEYKPPALITIDDRVICFDGNPTTLLDKIKNFKTWMEVK